MNTKVHRFLQVPRKILIGLVVSLFPLITFSQHQIDLNNVALQNITIKLPVGSVITPNITITDQNAGENVFWSFASTPFGATVTTVNGFKTQFEFHGIRVALPAGVSDANPVPPLSTTVISQTPTDAGTFFFDLTLTAGSKTANAHIEVQVTKDLDIVLVLDRSGSMTYYKTLAGITRWEALKKAASVLALRYSALNRSNDQVRLVYFDFTPTPISTCCDAPKKVTASLSNEFLTDFVGKDPDFGGTAMGDALKKAQSKLIPVNAAKTSAILFFTDGEQNPAQIKETGDGYLAGTGSIPAKGQPNHLKIFTIGFEGTAPMGDLLQNLATHTDATYHHSETGEDLAEHFDDALNNLMSGSSPQLVARSTHNVPTGGPPVTLESFPLNNNVDKLQLKFVFGRNFESSGILQTVARMKVQKDGANMLQYARPAWVGNFGNTLILTLDFVTPPRTVLPINPAGQWTVSISDSILKINTVALTVIADDHRLHIARTFGNSDPRVNQSLPISVNLDWLSFPIKNATVEAVIMRPGEDLGHQLAINTSNVQVSNTPDAGTPGRQKFHNLWAGDANFRALFNKTNNVVPLTHTADGKYQGTFNGLTVSGTYKLLIRISGTDSAAGQIQRLVSENFYTGIAGIDMGKSAVSLQVVNGQLVMNFKPTTPNNTFAGPGLGNSFSLTNPGISIVKVDDHQDGRYTITFNGTVNDTTTLILLGQPIYTGKLSDAGKGGGILDDIRKWFEDNGIPFWLFWFFLLLLLIIILWLLFRKKK